MSSKKAVTEPVLIIGVLIIAATILLLGTTRVLVPLIKTQTEFLAQDMGYTIHTVYAAPENLNLHFKMNTQKTPQASVRFFGKTNLASVEVAIPSPGRVIICKDNSLTFSFKDANKEKPTSFEYYPDNVKGIFSIKMIKTWDEINRKNSIKFCEKC